MVAQQCPALHRIALWFSAVPCMLRKVTSCMACMLACGICLAHGCAVKATINALHFIATQ